MVRKPASMSRKASGPMATMSDRPMAESNEYRPPTQSQNSNMLAGSIPKSATRSALVDTATKWRLTASSPSAEVNQARAVRALVSVSMVPKVLDDTTNSVSAGSRSWVAPQASMASTFEHKRTRMDRSE